MEAIRGLTREQQSEFIQNAAIELNNTFKEIWNIVHFCTFAYTIEERTRTYCC
jgi:hypothetical protein